MMVSRMRLSALVETRVERLILVIHAAIRIRDTADF